MLSRQSQEISTLGDKHRNRSNGILGLNAIGSNILHGSSAHLTRNKRKILDTPQVTLDAPLHQVIPLKAGLDLDFNSKGEFLRIDL
jgi:hypothetical protein